MKKVTTLIVIGLYIGGILIISFFGAALSGLSVRILATSVNFLNEEITKDHLDRKYIQLTVEEDEFPLKLKLEYKVFPDNATDASIYFVYRDNAEEEGITVSDEGLIIFGEWPGKGGWLVLTIEIITSDGSNKSDEVTITVECV